MSGGPNKVVPVRKEVIEHRLLVALNDQSKVAILAEEKDLDLLIAGMESLVQSDELRSNEVPFRDMLDSLKQLRKEAFNK